MTPAKVELLSVLHTRYQPSAEDTPQTDKRTDDPMDLFSLAGMNIGG
jgi:hypothetical protein